MKKVNKILFLLVIVFFNFQPRNKLCFATETTTYAKALSGCNLYKTQNFSNSYEDIYFQVPETYFMIVLETIGDNCFKVQYDRFIGYVDASTVIIATFVPIVKTLSNITFDIKSTSGTQIWSSPSTNSNVYTTIAAGTKDINYIASIYGSVPSGGESNVWYYVSYVSDTNSTSVFEGYVYSENTINLTEIVANTESNPEVILNESQDGSAIFLISSTLKTILVCVIAIPLILFFAILLYKFVNFLAKNARYNKKIENTSNVFSGKINENNADSNSDNFGKFKNLVRLKRQKQNVLSQSDDISDDELL